jgi:hypothetical protein
MFNEAIYTTQAGFNVAADEAKNSSLGDRPVSRAIIHARARNRISPKTIRR